MMKTFHWKVDPDMGVDSEPQVSVVRFGDGYEQRRASGINNDLKKYSVTTRDESTSGKVVVIGSPLQADTTSRQDGGITRPSVVLRQ